MKNKKSIKGILGGSIILGSIIYFLQPKNDNQSNNNSMNDNHVNPQNNVPKTLNFSMSEFNSKDGEVVPQKYWGNLQKLMNELQKVRNHINKPIKINSGYRSIKHNARVGGVPNSYHTLSMAADIVVSGMSAKEVQLMIEDGIIKGLWNFGGLGSYKNFTHVDIRPNKSRWSQGVE